MGRLAGGLIAGDVPLCAGDFWGGVDWGGVVPLCAGDFRGGVVLSGIDARALGAWWWGCAGYVSGCGRLMGSGGLVLGDRMGWLMGGQCVGEQGVVGQDELQLDGHVRGPFEACQTGDQGVRHDLAL